MNDNLEDTCINIMIKQCEAARERILELERQLRQACDLISEIAYGKSHSGVIPCPQDYQFYIEPWRKMAQQFMAEEKL